MIRCLGALMLSVGCSWIGFRASWELRAAERALEESETGLRLLEEELELGEAPLPQMMEELIDRTEGQARALFQDCRQALDRLDREAFSQAWPALVGRRKELGERGKACLYPLGEILGRYDSRAQARGIASVRRRLAEERARTAEERRRQGKVYQTLGVAGGAFLVILLI